MFQFHNMSIAIEENSSKRNSFFFDDSKSQFLAIEARKKSRQMAMIFNVQEKFGKSPNFHRMFNFSIILRIVAIVRL